MSEQTTPHDDYQRRATKHRPNCPRCLERIARDMRKQGWTTHDIGRALGISAAAVEQLVGEPEARP